MRSAPDQAPAASPRRAASEETAVLHLVRQANGIEPFARFLSSYRDRPAGAEHQLILVYKGFTGKEQLEPYRALAADLPVRSLSVPDHGFDLGAYRRAALELTHRRLLLLNSFSVILAERWLEYLTDALAPRVAAVAASGSWGSHASHVRYNLALGGPYARVFPDRASTERVFAELATAADSQAPVPEPAKGAAALALEALRTIVRQTSAFSAFPSPHLRTNGLLVGREDWLTVAASPPDKATAHRLESGRRGITAGLCAGGREVRVVGRDGRAYASEEWPASFTFWQQEQQNLLIADNQTLAYETGGELRKRVLSAYAWGEQAQPGAAASPSPSGLRAVS